MADDDDSRKGAQVIPLAGRVRRTGPAGSRPKAAKPAPPPEPKVEQDEDEDDDESDERVLVELEEEGLDEVVAAAEREAAGGDPDAVENLARQRNKRALRNFLRGEHDAAFAEWQALIDQDPRLTNALELRRFRLEEVGDLEGARRDLDHLIRLSPASAEAYQWRGLFFCIHEDYARARIDYEHAARLAPGDHQIYVHLARACSLGGDRATSIRAYGRAIKLAPWRAELYVDRGAEFRFTGARDEAVRDFTRALELDPKNLEALRSRAALRRLPEGAAAALPDLTRALEIEPDDWETLRVRAACYEALGDFARAAEDLGRAIEARNWKRDDERRDDLVGLFSSRAEAYMKLGARVEAAEDLEWIIGAQHGWDADTYVRLAEMHREAGDLASAAAVYSRAMSRHPIVYEELRMQIDEHRELEQKDAFAADLDLMLLINPQHTDFLGERAAMRAEAGEYEAALADLDRALSDGAAAYREDLFRQRADVWSALDQDDKAIEDLSRAIAIAPYEGENHGWRGLRRAFRDGPSPEAEADVDRGVELSPDDLTTHFLRAWYLELCDRPDEALAEYDRRVEIYPELGILYFQRAKARFELYEGEAALRAALDDVDLALANEYADPEVLALRDDLRARLGAAASDQPGPPGAAP